MWTLEPRSGVLRAVAAAAYVTAVVVFLLLQELGLRLRRREERAWWAGSGRDLLNVLGLAAIVGSLRLVGFAGPAALAVGGTATLALFGASALAPVGAARRRAWTLAAGIAVTVPIVLFPGAVAAAFAKLAGALFPASR